MKKSIFFLSLLLVAFSSNAQQTKAQAQFSIDSLLPSGSAVRMTEIRKALTKALNYAEPNTVDLLKAGANPNGITNTTAAVLAAFAQGKKVYVPKGTYLINQPIEIKNNVECEKGAVFKIANNYNGVAFYVKSQKHINIKNLYVDASGTNIKVTGLKIEGLWSSIVENPCFIAALDDSDTSSIAIDIYTSPATALSTGTYSVTILNPYLIRGKYGIRTDKTPLDNVAITHLSIKDGWISRQSNKGILLNHTFNFSLDNIGFDDIRTGTAGISLVNCHQAKILIGEYNSGTLLDIASSSDFIHIDSPRSLDIPTAISGNNFTIQSAGEIRLYNNSSAYTKIRSNNLYSNPFEIRGVWGGGGEYQIIGMHPDNGLIFHTRNPDATGSNMLGVNSAGGLVKVSARKMTQSTAAPTTGTWEKSDYCENYDPDAGEYFGWVCVVAGSPGVWKGYGLIQN